MVDVEHIELTLICFEGLNVRAAYVLYRDMRVWLERRGIDYRFGWLNTGKYIPDCIRLDRESATAFRLVFNV